MIQLPENLNRRIEHTLLAQDAVSRDIERLCREALDNRFFGVVVNPSWVSEAAEALRESDVRVISVAGFPLGANRTDVKIREAVEAVEDGAREIDMVAAIGRLVENRHDYVRREIEEIRVSLPDTVILKVIIEAGRLSREQQQDAARAIADAGAHFVKTSTGFFGGATVEQVRTLAEAAAGRIGVKASGGIRTLPQCCDLIEAGATRIGSSASVAIMREYAARIE